MDKDRLTAQPRLSTWLLITAIFLLFLSSIVLESHLFMSWDVCWLLEATQRLLAGGTYMHNFVEINPPMILFLYSLPVLVHQHLSLTLPIAFRSSVYCLALVSLVLSNHCLKQQLHHKHPYYRIFFTLVLCFLLVIFPTSEFGQRENLLMMLTLPYFIHVAMRLRQRCASKWMLIVIGLLAGIGFSIKPYFLCAFFLVELLLMLRLKQWFSWIRVESMMVAVVVVLYVLSIWLFTPSYIKMILPMVSRLYLNYQLDSWGVLLVNPLTLVPLGAALLYLTVRARCEHPNLLSVFAVGMVGFFVAYFLQGKVWFYHTIPMITMGVLVAVIVSPDVITSIKTSHEKTIVQQVLIWAGLSLFVLVLIIPFFMVYQRATAFMALKRGPNTTTQLIQYAKQHAKGGSLMLVSSYSPPGQIVPVYSGVKSASRFPDFWPVPGILRLALDEKTTLQEHEIKHDKHFVLDAMAQDMKNNSPVLVFIDTSPNPLYFPKGVRFNYLTFFNQSPAFKKLLRSYEFQTKIGRFAVYRKVDE